MTILSGFCFTEERSFDIRETSQCKSQGKHVKTPNIESCDKDVAIGGNKSNVLSLQAVQLWEMEGHLAQSDL